MLITMKLSRGHLVTILIFGLPILFYYYAVMYESAYLGYYGIPTSSIQVSPFTLLNTFFVMQTATAALTIISIALAAFLYLVSKVRLMQKEIPIRLPRQITPTILQNGQRTLLVGVFFCVILVVIPYMNTKVANFYVRKRIVNPICASIDRSDATFGVIRQYGVFLIVKEYNSKRKQIDSSGPYRIVEADKTVSINVPCK